MRRHLLAIVVACNALPLPLSRNCMKSSFKFATLAALTAATLALPAAAQDMKNSAKCKPKTGLHKCMAKKCAPNN